VLHLLKHVWFLLIFVMAACQPTVTPTPAPLDIRPQDGLIQWQRNPNQVLFRIEIIGGEDPFLGQGVIPDCTIYGNNHVVWKNDLEANNSEILEDLLTDEGIVNFVNYLTIRERIYTYRELLPEMQARYEVVPVVEHVRIAVNDVVHKADNLSGWDPLWYDRVTTACKTLSQAPVLVLPTSAWLTTREVEFDTRYPLVIWSAMPNADAAGQPIRLSAAVDSPTWVSGLAISELWKTVRRLPNDTLYQEDDRFYNIVLQVPGITRDSPSAPASIPAG